MTPTTISIVLSTYNRGETLRQTLENFCLLDSGSLKPQFVVVDNNSADDTPEIIASFQERLPLIHLTQPLPGKNRALNLAIEEVNLGDIVLFTDDDVKPSKDWLLEVANACDRNPSVDAFGGIVEMLWPDETPAHIRALEFSVFPQHRYNGIEEPYARGKTPIGPNFWTRKKLFDEGLRYLEDIGPVPNAKHRIMGSETSFLLNLQKNGYEILHVPTSKVGHYLTPDQLTQSYVESRAKTHGRFLAYLGKPFDDPENYQRRKILWLTKKCLAFTWHKLRYFAANLYLDKTKKTKAKVETCKWAAFNKAYLTKHAELWERRRSF